MSKKIIPFSSGSDYRSWTGLNCDQCNNQYDPDTREIKCIFEDELAIAYVYNGRIEEDLKEFFVGTKGNFNMKYCKFKNCDLTRVLLHYKNEKQLILEV